jgi:hypothetical protein
MLQHIHTSDAHLHATLTAATATAAAAAAKALLLQVLLLLLWSWVCCCCRRPVGQRDQTEVDAGTAMHSQQQWQPREPGSNGGCGSSGTSERQPAARLTGVPAVGQDDTLLLLLLLLLLLVWWWQRQELHWG